MFTLMTYSLMMIDDEVLGSSSLTEILEHSPMKNYSSFRFENV